MVTRFCDLQTHTKWKRCQKGSYMQMWVPKKKHMIVSGRACEGGARAVFFVTPTVSSNPVHTTFTPWRRFSAFSVSCWGRHIKTGIRNWVHLPTAPANSHSFPSWPHLTTRRTRTFIKPHTPQRNLSGSDCPSSFLDLNQMSNQIVFFFAVKIFSFCRHFCFHKQMLHCNWDNQILIISFKICPKTQFLRRPKWHLRIFAHLGELPSLFYFILLFNADFIFSDFRIVPTPWSHWVRFFFFAEIHSL